MKDLVVALEALAATGLEVAEAAVVVLVAMSRGHRRAALAGAGGAAVVVVAAAAIAGPRTLALVPTDRLREVLGAALLLLGLFWLLQAALRPRATAQELEREAERARRRAQRGALAAALVAAKAVGIEGAEAAVLVVGIGSPQHALTAATAGAAVAAVGITVLALRVESRLQALAGRTLNRVAGTALVLVGAFWLADGSHLDAATTTALLVGLAALAAACWATPVLAYGRRARRGFGKAAPSPVARGPVNGADLRRELPKRQDAASSEETEDNPDNSGAVGEPVRSPLDARRTGEGS